MNLSKAGTEQIRQMQKMDALGGLTGGVAHDFNNLLTLITGNLELPEMKIADENLRIMVEQTQEAACFGASFTSRLLAFARSQSLEMRVMDLNDLVTQTTELLRSTIGETFEVTTMLGGSLWKTMADPGMIENALLNLAINGRDAMPTGGNLVIESANVDLDETEVEHASHIQSGRYVVLSVTDSGTGMSDEVRQRAVDPFFTTKEIGSGTGLGLSMIYGFFTQSGGYIDIQSELGSGTTVKIYLPRHVGEGIASDSDAVDISRTTAATI